MPDKTLPELEAQADALNMPDKTLPELEAQADAMIQMLTVQLNHAQAQWTNCIGYIAILEMRIAALTPATKGTADGGD